MSTTVKIVSNPYTKTVSFFLKGDVWRPITSITDPNSRLLSKDLVGGFFPFKAKEIVNGIVDEFRPEGQGLTIVFEGSDDEYEELQSVCDDAEYAGFLTLERSDKRLPNARDVLPDIIRVFQDIRPLVDESVMEKEKVSRELKKFYDVSSDLIPLCVLGNYSAGKSTFINALIGHELLPNGDEPVTAKVFEIRRSNQRDRALIRFDFGETTFSLRFNNAGLIQDETLADNPFYQDIIERVSESELKGLIGNMNCVLQMINDFKPKKDGPNVSDLIQIEVPFCASDPWSQSNEFVIFDTPGSNSASNEDHARVLRDAMDGLSNGLPIYVAEYDSLDSTDNEKLYDEIRQIEAMDERFAMIIVNKADGASLPKGGFDKRQRQNILDQAIPSNLYAQGIYFVSSILGLGSKIKGEFVNDFYAEKYEDQSRKYSDPSNRFYKMLYRYNILPGQIGERTIEESEKCSDLVFANSGLYCVEQEIVLFGERYSAYNKCHQSEGLLRKVIEITADEIEAAKERREKSKKDREEALDRDKRELIERLDETGDNVELNAMTQYPLCIAENVASKTWKLSEEQLRNREGELTDENREERDFDDQSEDARNARKAVFSNAASRVADAVTKYEKGKIKAAFDEFVDDIEDAGAKSRAVHDAAVDADRETADELLEEVKDQLRRSSDVMEESVDAISKKYWNDTAEAARDALYKLATNSEVLSEEKRNEIADIIIKYPEIAFEPNPYIQFDKSELLKDFRIWNLVIVSSNKLNLGKLARVYNEEVDKTFSNVCESIRDNHEASFKIWLDQLLERIVDNITDYNPVLHNHSEIIREDTEKIAELTNKLHTLERCTEQVARMIDWRG